MAIYYQHQPVFGVVVGRSLFTGGYLVNLDGSTETTSVSSFITAREVDFHLAWHVYIGTDLYAGGPGISKCRAFKLAAKYGGRVVFGLAKPATGSVVIGR